MFFMFGSLSNDSSDNSVKYLIDTNVFIQAKDSFYGMDIAPSFWKQIDERIRDGRLTLCRFIVDELTKGKDNLSRWIVNNDYSEVILEESFYEDVLDNYEKISDYVESHPKWSDENKKKFLKGADSWVIAVAMAVNGIVVTQEKKIDDANNTKKVKIPNVAEHFGVETMDIFTYMRETNMIL